MGMTNKRLYITSPQYNISLIYPNSHLITRADNTFDNIEYHTSLGDISTKDLLKIVKHFQYIRFIPDMFDISSDIYFETVEVLQFLKHTKNVENIKFDNPINFTDYDITNRSTDPLLWVFGCSHSFGSGLQKNEVPFGNVLSDMIDIPLKLVAKPGSSTNWSLRHLLNSSIHQDDVVIWQITTPDRITTYAPLKEIQLSRCHDKNILNFYTDDQIFFNHISILNTGINYLRSRKIKFILTSLLNNNPYFYKYKLEYTKHREFCYTPSKFNIDLASDNLHMGPLSHKMLAVELLNHIKSIYE